RTRPDHAVRHRDDARPAGREGLPDHRPGHRRDGDAAGSGHGLDRVEEEARLRRQALALVRGGRDRIGQALSADGVRAEIVPSVLGPGRCAQTLLARVEVILVPVDRQTFRILVRPSFAAYLRAWFRDATDAP